MIQFLEENRLISYRVVETLPDSFQMWLWSIYRRLENTYGDKMKDIQKLMIAIDKKNIVVTIFEDNQSHNRLKICYSNIFDLTEMCVWLNYWKLYPYVIMDVLHVGYADGGRLDAR